MRTASPSALTLASRLRTLDDAALTALLRARPLRGTSIKDFFDLADALLDRTAVQHCLATLDRPTLVTLAALAELGHATADELGERLQGDREHVVRGAAERADRLARLALCDRDEVVYTCYEPVAEQLHAWPTLGLPSTEELAETPPPAALDPVPTGDARFVDRAAAERAFDTVGALSELVAELAREPARELAKGGLGLPELRRIAAAIDVDLDEVPPLHGLAVEAELLSIDGGRWAPTESGQAWRREPGARRWALLAAAWHAGLNDDIRDALSRRAHAAWGDGLADYLAWLYPAGGEWMRERVRSKTREADLLGITAMMAPSTPGSALLAHGYEAAEAAMAALLPTEVEAVYLQHDLSIVSPGPLAAAVDERLRGIAELESRGLASHFRITPGSITRGLSYGETVDSMREFLGGISLTGIPQPLDYLLNETARRFGALRVGKLDQGEAAEYGAQSYVRSDDEYLVGTVAIDHALSPLSLVRTGPHRLISRFDPELVYWSLSEARYPVAAEDAEGRIVLVRRAPARVHRSAAGDPVSELVKRLRIGAEAQPAEAGQAWLTRQLDAAIRGRLALTVTVTLPDGREVDYQLEPAALAGGRLRARDRAADIERTLPLSHITGIAPAG